MTMAEPNGCSICGHHWTKCACTATNRKVKTHLPSAGLNMMEKYKEYKNKFWCDLTTDIEKSEFIRCGRAYETGLIAHAIQDEIADIFEQRQDN